MKKTVWMRGGKFGDVGQPMDIDASARAVRFAVFTGATECIDGIVQPVYGCIEFRDSWERRDGLEVWTPDGEICGATRQ